jgi:hypothetical protein
MSLAQNSVNYDYDANGNRIKRWMSPPQPITLPQNNTQTDHLSLVEDVNRLITKDSFSIINGITDTANSYACLSQNEIKVFPNPLQQELNIQFKDKEMADGFSLNLFDGGGKLFYRGDNVQVLTNINMRESMSGIYFLILEHKNGKRLYWKLIKS